MHAHALSHILPHLLAEDVGLEEVEDGARLVGRHELVEDRAEEQVERPITTQNSMQTPAIIW